MTNYSSILSFTSLIIAFAFLTSFSSPLDANEPSVAYKTASLDAGKMLDPSDKIIPRYEVAMAILAKRFGVPETVIADQTRSVVKYLTQKNNMKVSSLELMEAIAKMDQNTEMKLDYSSTIAAVATLMIDQSKTN